MSDLITAIAAHEAAAQRLEAATETRKTIKAEVDDAFTALLVAAQESDDKQIADVAAAIVYTEGELDTKVNDEDTGTKALTKKVRDRAMAMREAAKSGDARAAERDLAEAEDELTEAKADVKELRKARKAYEKQLFSLLKGIA